MGRGYGAHTPYRLSNVRDMTFCASTTRQSNARNRNVSWGKCDILTEASNGVAILAYFFGARVYINDELSIDNGISQRLLPSFVMRKPESWNLVIIIMSVDLGNVKGCIEAKEDAHKINCLSAWCKVCLEEEKDANTIRLLAHPVTGQNEWELSADWFPCWQSLLLTRGAPAVANAPMQN